MTDESKSITARNSSEFGLWVFFFFFISSLSVSCGIISFPSFTSKPAFSVRCLSGPGKSQTQALGADMILLTRCCCLGCTTAPEPPLLPAHPGCLRSCPSQHSPWSSPLGLLLWEMTPKTVLCPPLALTCNVSWDRATPSMDQLTRRAQAQRCAGKEVLKAIKKH